MAEHLFPTGPVPVAEMEEGIKWLSTCLSCGRQVSTADASNCLVQSVLRCFYNAGKTKSSRWEFCLFHTFFGFSQASQLLKIELVRLELGEGIRQQTPAGPPLCSLSACNEVPVCRHIPSIFRWLVNLSPCD